MPDTPESGSSSKSFFTQKVAGVPLVAWVAVVAVGVGGFLWWHNKQTAAAAGANQNATVPTAATSEELQAAGLYQPPNITYDLSGPSIETPTSPPPTQVTQNPIPVPNQASVIPVNAQQVAHQWPTTYTPPASTIGRVPAIGW